MDEIEELKRENKKLLEEIDELREANQMWKNKIEKLRDGICNIEMAAYLLKNSID